MGNIDAVFGWRVFQFWNPEKIRSIPIGQQDLTRIGYIPAAVSVYCKNKEVALKYINLDPESFHYIG